MQMYMSRNIYIFSMCLKCRLLAHFECATTTSFFFLVCVFLHLVSILISFHFSKVSATVLVVSKSFETLADFEHSMAESVRRVAKKEVKEETLNVHAFIYVVESSSSNESVWYKYSIHWHFSCVNVVWQEKKKYLALLQWVCQRWTMIWNAPVERVK